MRNDFRPIILTHEPGKRYWGENSWGGSMIMLIEKDGSEQLLLGNSPAHGLEIADISAVDSVVSFRTARDQGMQHFDVYHYILLHNYVTHYTRIMVTAFEAGRPEMMEHDPSWYVAREQERLNKLGYDPTK
ncbi:MAG: hypothetical protein N2376_03325 [Clostridia bacterium]|nr:hypothetical protein [Clostridia bacterium]